MKAKLTAGSGDTGDLRKLISQDPELRQAQLESTDVSQVDNHTISPFVLHIPSFEPQLGNGGFSEEDRRFGVDRPKFADVEDVYEEDPLQSEALTPPVVIDKPMPRSPQLKDQQLRKEKLPKYSRHGIAYSKIPSGITKALASSFARSSSNRKSRFDKESTRAIAEAGERFLEQLAGDLDSVSQHAGRKIINETDVIVLMRR